MTDDIDLEKELGALALPGDDLLGRSLHAARWFAALSPDGGAVVHALAAIDMLRQPRKRPRIAHCLIGLYDRLQRLEAKIDPDRVRGAEYADHLEDGFRRVSNEPDGDRRRRLELILANLALRREERPTFEQERMLIRLADELSVRHVKVVLAHQGAPQQLGPDERMLSRSAILGRRTQVADLEGAIEDLCSFRVMERSMLNQKVHVESLVDGLTPTGRRFIEFLQD
jgi:hypothetical protein